MTDWATKRFWTKADVSPCDGGFQLFLDTRPVKTPSGRILVTPIAEMAAAAALEWDAQTDTVDPRTMPVTRSINSALDQTAPQRDGVIDMLAAYAETDLLCYRADGPESLVAAQAAAWDPMLDWAADRYGARLAVTSGVVPIAQDATSLRHLRAALTQFGDFGLTGLYDLISISGSIVLGLAVAEKRVAVDDAWAISRIDEEHQIAQWGRDEEADAHAARRAAAFTHAARMVAWSGKA